MEFFNRWNNKQLSTGAFNAMSTEATIDSNLIKRTNRDLQEVAEISTEEGGRNKGVSK